MSDGVLATSSARRRALEMTGDPSFAHCVQLDISLTDTCLQNLLPLWGTLHSCSSSQHTRHCCVCSLAFRILLLHVPLGRHMCINVLLLAVHCGLPCTPALPRAAVTWNDILQLAVRRTMLRPLWPATARQCSPGRARLWRSTGGARSRCSRGPMALAPTCSWMTVVTPPCSSTVSDSSFCSAV
jgi:hypothetical protein